MLEAKRLPVRIVIYCQVAQAYAKLYRFWIITRV
jgi:hypothetical protein